jgi:hypothetical protein
MARRARRRSRSASAGDVRDRPGQREQGETGEGACSVHGAGRRVPGSNRGSAGRTGGARADRTAVRAWAQASGLTVSERGRISAYVMRQYEAAH